MSLTDLVIIALVLAVFTWCVWKNVKSAVRGDACADCSIGDNCSVRITGEGACPAAEDMLRRLEAATKDLPSVQG